jgi:hypothetical protein
MAKPSILVEKPSDALKRILGERVSVEFLQLYPEMVDAMAEGEPAPTWNDLITRKIVAAAADPKKTNQWAIEMILERVEGRAVQGEPASDGGRAIEERLDDITQRHLNDLAAQFVESGGLASSAASGEPAAAADGPASKLMGLPGNRAGGSQAT